MGSLCTTSESKEFLEVLKSKGHLNNLELEFDIKMRKVYNLSSVLLVIKKRKNSDDYDEEGEFKV